VKRRDLEQIKIFAKQYEAEVNAIRAEANAGPAQFKRGDRKA
jgi:hypothetical protein